VANTRRIIPAVATDSEAMRSMANELTAKAVKLRARLQNFRDPTIQFEMSKIADDYDRMAEQMTGMSAIQQKRGL
jgi:hypothetical protein